MGFGTNKWHFLSFVGTWLSANNAPSGPHTTPLVPLTLCLEFFSLAPRFVENLCTPGVDSCQRDGCPKGPEGFNKGHWLYVR
jgi:hypothetical protein